MKNKIDCIQNLIIIALGILLTVGCATTPVPVRVMDMNPKSPTEFANGEKFVSEPVEVALVVRDSRSAVTSKSNICGLKRNGYYIPMSVAFLAHREGLDDIMMRRCSKLLSAAGYTIQSKTPDIDKPEGDGPKKRDGRTAKRQSGSVKSERKMAKADFMAAKKAGGSEAVDIDVASAVNAPSVFAGHAPNQAIVELNVRSYFSDIVPFSSLLWPFIQSWMVADVYVYQEADGSRNVIYGKKLRSYNSVVWAPIDFGGETSYNLSMNKACRDVLRQAETLFYSNEFRDAVQKANQLCPEMPKNDQTVAEAKPSLNAEPIVEVADASTQLEKLSELKNAGLLTEEEFEAKRKELVGQL